MIFNPLVSLADTLRLRPRPLPRGLRRGAGTRCRRPARAAGGRSRRRGHTRAAPTTWPSWQASRASSVEVAYVGAEERVFGPGWSPAEPFTVLFVGKLIPLHGVETVLAAARAAPELRFRLVGSGQLETLVRDRPANVDWVPWVEYERLPDELHRAGCALGIFGTSEKAKRVIPNKAFQALACGTPLVTADTAGARELLVDGESALLVPPGDPRALAAALQKVAADPELAQRLSAGGRATYEAHASEDVLGGRWRELVEQAVARA